LLVAPETEKTIDVDLPPEFDLPPGEELEEEPPKEEEILKK
jgi:hypothetical protein